MKRQYRVVLFHLAIANFDYQSVKNLITSRNFKDRLESGLIRGVLNTKQEDPLTLVQLAHPTHTAFKLISVRLTHKTLFGVIESTGHKHRAFDKLVKDQKSPFKVNTICMTEAGIDQELCHQIESLSYPPAPSPSSPTPLWTQNMASNAATITKPAKKPTAKAVFKGIKPVESKNVTVYFDQAFRVNPKTRFDGYMKQLDGRLGVLVRHPDQGSDVFAIPYARPSESVDRKAMESSLRGAMKARKLEIVPLEDMNPKK